MFDTMDSIEVVDTINEYLERQADIVLRYGGTIDKYLGDGAMFVFNARRASGDSTHTAKAVEAAVAMQRDFVTLKRSWSELGMPLPALYNRVTVACGQVLLPIMGHPQFQQVTVFGDTVGRAAHLCEAAPRDHNVLLVDAVVRSEAGARFSMREITSLADPRAGGTAYEVDWESAVDVELPVRTSHR